MNTNDPPRPVPKDSDDAASFARWRLSRRMPLSSPEVPLKFAQSEPEATKARRRSRTPTMRVMLRFPPAPTMYHRIRLGAKSISRQIPLFPHPPPALATKVLLARGAGERNPPAASGFNQAGAGSTMCGSARPRRTSGRRWSEFGRVRPDSAWCQPTSHVGDFATVCPCQHTSRGTGGTPCADPARWAESRPAASERNPRSNSPRPQKH